MVLVVGALRQLRVRRGRFNGADGDAIRRDNFYSEKEGILFFHFEGGRRRHSCRRRSFSRTQPM
jgi:hypothetical protein